jgi:AcrR family transcriptional regulator
LKRPCTRPRNPSTALGPLAASQLLHQKGVESTTLVDIAAAADVPAGNVYYYFKTKDEIITAVTRPGRLLEPDTVLAAAIGVGGTVIVGVAGFSATVLATGKTIRAARDSRVSDKRAEVYIDAIAAVHYRQIKRLHDAQIHLIDDETDRRVRAYLEAYAEPDWYALESRLLAFGSRPVITAVQASSTAALLAAGFPAMEVLGEGAADLALDIAGRKALHDANNADNALIELIRAELQGKGHPLAQWAAAGSHWLTERFQDDDT